MIEAPRKRTAQQGENIALHVIAWSVGILALIAIVAAAKIASTIVVPAVVAALFALTLSPIVAALERLRVPTTLAAATVVGLCVVGFVGGAYLLMPSAADWRHRAPTVARAVELQLRNIERGINKGVDQATAGRAGQLGGGNSTTDAVIESGHKLVSDMLLSAPDALMALISSAFLCFFLLAERASLRRVSLSLVWDWKTRLRLSRAMLEMRRSVSLYLLTITIVNAALGGIAAIAFWRLGLPSAPLWGVMVALSNFIPYIGPMIANLIIFAVGLASFNNLTDALYPVLALAALNTVEGQFVTPMVVGHGARVGPLSVFLALIFGVWIWGVLGALVATPLLIVATSVWRRVVVIEPASAFGPDGGRRRNAR